MKPESQFAEMRPDGSHRKQTEVTEANPVPTRVLVVDDDPSVADTLTAILRNAGYETVAAYDGLSGLRQCEDFRPQVVIADVFMPGMNGVELAIVIQQLYPVCRVMLFSGGEASAAALIEQARQDGYDFELWAKPTDPTGLLTKLAVRAVPAFARAVSG
jgi:CheY-like chemotaxis protein